MFTTIIVNDLEFRVMLSLNFSRGEFACGCGCGFATVDTELLKVLEVVRKRFNSPVTINSGCRCEYHNLKVGGSYGSKHKQGIAADMVVKGIEPEIVYEFLDSHQPNRYGVGCYKSFTHIDIRGKKARWKG